MTFWRMQLYERLVLSKSPDMSTVKMVYVMKTSMTFIFLWNTEDCILKNVIFHPYNES